MVGKGDEAIQHNIEEARKLAFALVKKGHIPFVPHTMMDGWEDRYSMDREVAMKLCERWVEHCDAMFYIGNSPGVERERKVAQKLGLSIYQKLEDVPEISNGENLPLSSQALQLYQEEYKQCAECYRHTYSTIWQAGGLIAAGAGLLAASGNTIVQMFAPLPPLAWYLAVFLPMDSYGKYRSSRLQALETLFNSSIPGLHMAHFFSIYDYIRSEAERQHPIIGHWGVNRSLGVIMICLAVLQVILFYFVYQKLF